MRRWRSTSHAIGCGLPGRQMMSSTAALQVNVDAGPAHEWASRVTHVHAIGPVLSAISGCSPMIAGSSSGWSSMREQAWRGIDRARTAPLHRSSDPALAWAEYALAAPVMLVHDGDDATPVRSRVPLAQWIRAARSSRANSDDRRRRLPPHDTVPTRTAAWLSRASLPRCRARPVVAGVGHHRGNADR